MGTIWNSSHNIYVSSSPPWCKRMSKQWGIKWFSAANYSGLITSGFNLHLWLDWRSHPTLELTCHPQPYQRVTLTEQTSSSQQLIYNNYVMKSRWERTPLGRSFKWDFKGQQRESSGAVHLTVAACFIPALSSHIYACGGANQGVVAVALNSSYLR